MQQKIDKSIYLVWMENPCTIRLFEKILPERVGQIMNAMISNELLKHPNMIGEWAKLLGKKLILEEIMNYNEFVFVDKKEGENQNGA